MHATTTGYIVPEYYNFRTSPPIGLKFADVPNGRTALSKLPVLGGAQIIAFARLFETHNRSNSMTEHHIETTGFFQVGEMGIPRWKALLDSSDTETVISSWAPVQLVAGGCVAAANYKCEAAGAAFTARFEADETSTNEENDENETDTSPCEEEYGKKDSKD
eukprot:symbB.v1.2.038496.t1/scaffold5891.1/size22729/3